MHLFCHNDDKIVVCPGILLNFRLSVYCRYQHILLVLSGVIFSTRSLSVAFGFCLRHHLGRHALLRYALSRISKVTVQAFSEGVTTRYAPRLQMTINQYYIYILSQRGTERRMNNVCSALCFFRIRVLNFPVKPAKTGRPSCSLHKT